MVVIGGERNAQADNGRAEMVCNDNGGRIKYNKLQKPQKNKRDTGRNNTNAKRNVKRANTKA